MREYLQRLEGWIKGELEQVKLFKFPNATIFGEPVIDHGQVSGFSGTDYMMFPFLVDFAGRDWKIDFAFATGDDVTTEQSIIASEYGLSFGIESGHFNMRLSSDGETWDICDTAGTFDVLPGLTYYVRLEFDGEKYTASVSIDKENYTVDIEAASVLSLFPVSIYIGVGGIASGTPTPLLGSINMNYATVSISDNVIWAGMDDAGLETRASVDLSNLDASGIARLRTLAATPEVEVSGTDIDMELEPNKFYLFGTLDSLRFTLGEQMPGIVNLFTFAFTSNAETMEAPTTIEWAEGVEVSEGSVTIEPGKKYEVNIRRGLALISEWGGN